MKIFVDTNIFLRFLLADHPKQSPACRRLFEKAKTGKITLVTLPIIIAEVVWVLASFYKEPREEISRKLRIIVLFKGLEIPFRDTLLLAIQFFSAKKIDFIDAYVAAWVKTERLKKMYSYDRDFDKIEGILRKEP